MPISLHGCRVHTRNGSQKRDVRVRYRPLLTGANLKTVTDEKKLELLKRVRLKDDEAISEMILCHIRLATSIVNRYIDIYSFDFYANDLDSAAMTGIVVAVNRVAAGRMANHDNITGFIVKYIHNYIIEAINYSTIIRVPRTAKHRKTEDLPKTVPVKDARLGIEEFEIWDAIESIANSSVEKQILKLKQEGFIDREIGEIMDLSRDKVCRMRGELYARYLRKEKAS